MEKFKDFLKDNSNARILDVGTGNGNFIHILTGLTNDFQEIIGIDLLDGAITAAQKSFDDERIQFLKMDALHMTFEDNSFDMVCLSNSLHHLEDITVSLREMERVLKPGGFLLISEMVSNDLTDKQKSHLLLHHFAAEIDRANGIFHDETFANDKIIDTLHSKSMLKVIDSWYLNVPNTKEFTKEEMDWVCSTTERMLSRVEQMPNYEYFKQKADDVKNYIKQHGFDSATQMIAILQQ
ncbi:MAG: class I SAM-dependent methyltransferase [Bacilli bacterium]|nr:class I SAM-dependent methyltransferase [Bacilli bacterium]